jgi:GT2 family glycosyltransferase
LTTELCRVVTLSILIVNWNSKDYLRRCLQTVRSTCAEMSPQIIVVDNASFDGCAEMLAAEFPEVEFVQSSENLGFGRANNLGFQRVRGEYLLLLNPDTELRPGAVARMVEALRTVLGAGITAPRLLNSDGSLQTSCVQALPTPWNQAMDCDLARWMFPRSKTWGTWEAFHSQAPVAVEAASGACMLMRSETFRQVGGFTNEYFMYGEDMDLCAKVWRNGLKVCHVPGAVVVHHGGGSSSQSLNRLSDVCLRDSVHRFIRMHQGLIAAVLYRALMTLTATIRLVVCASVWLCSGKVLNSTGSHTLRKWSAILRWSVGLEVIPKAQSPKPSCERQAHRILDIGRPTLD